MMKRFTACFLALTMMLSIALSLSACGKKAEDTKIDHEETVIEEGGSKTGADADTKEDIDEHAADIVKTIEPDAEDVIGKDIPLQIESVTLYKDGTIRIVPTDDLKKNELGDSEADSIMPFAESGNAKDIYVLRIGNGGYRVILALMDDGTISAVNALSLIEDHIAVVMDNVAGRDNFIGIEEVKNEGEVADGGGDDDSGGEGSGAEFNIVGKTEAGDDVVLDPVLLSDNARATAEDENEDE